MRSVKILSYSQNRILAIDKAIKELQAERDIHSAIVTRFENDVCQVCSGYGHVMKPIKGCECDGPRMHTCEACNGSGYPGGVDKA